MESRGKLTTFECPPKPLTGQDSSRFQVVQNPNGTHTVSDSASGEVMHSKIGAWEEAQLLYIQGSGLNDLLRFQSSEPLVIADVGMGIAANAWAAIDAALGCDRARKLEIISFENAIGGIRHAWEQEKQNPGPFPWLIQADSIGALSALLENGKWSSNLGNVEWQLHVGDFFENLELCPKVDLIFWDFYAPKSCPSLWSIDSFEKTSSIMKPTGRLHTYSASTSTRAALLLAGWYVGYGRGTTMKGETTVASLSPEKVDRPLGAEWLRKIQHSTKPFPLGDLRGLETFELLEKAIRATPHARKYFA